LGGGFGGLAAARELREILPSDGEIILISASDRFFMGFSKLWDLAGVRPLDEGCRSLATLAGRGIRFHHAEVTKIDPASVTVSTTDGDLAGDAILVALGTVPTPRHSELIAAAGGHNLYDARALPAMRGALSEVGSGRVAVAVLGPPFKCPPAPYEAAMIVDDLLRRRGVRDDVAVDVVTFQPMTLPAAGPVASDVLAGFLTDRNIGLRLRSVVADVNRTRGALRIEGSDDQVDYSVLLGVPAEMVPPVVEASPLVGPSGFIEPDRKTFRTAYSGVYAVGDCTMIPTATAQLPKAGVFAAAQGSVAARNIAADLYGGQDAVFDGRGMCFVELPDRRVAMVEGDFFAEPAPEVGITEASEDNFETKQAYERDRLAEWLD